MPNPVVHFEIMGKNVDALQSFYSKVFGWEVRQASAGSGVTDYRVIEKEPNGIGGGVGAAPEGYDGHVTFYVGVPDINAALDKVRSLGGTTMMGPDRVPDGPVIALFQDPEGHTIGLVETPA